MGHRAISGVLIVTRRQQGAVGLLLIALTGAILALVLGMFIATTSDLKQGIASSSTQSMQSMKQSILDFARQNKRLPTVPEFSLLTQIQENSIGRKPIYLVDDRFVTTTVCSLNVDGVIQLQECSADTNCLAPIATTGIAFILIDGGNNVLNLADPIYQSSSRAASEKITLGAANQQSPIQAEVVRKFSSGTLAGRFNNPIDAPMAYDDMIETASGVAVREAAGCNMKSQGDLLESGGDLRILNTSLPDALKNVPYSKTVIAYGRDNADYAFSAVGLPPGLNLNAIANSKTALISGTPTTEGIYSITISVRVTATGYDRTSGRTLQLKVLPCTTNWVNSGSPSSYTCPMGYTGSLIQQLQIDSCSGGTQLTTISGSCVCEDVWRDSGNTRPQSCPTGQSGSITEKEQVNTCSSFSPRWVPMVNTCSPLVPMACNCQRLGLSPRAKVISPSSPSCNDNCCSNALNSGSVTCGEPNCVFSASCNQ